MSTILVVDDNEQNRYVLRTLLTASGDQVLEAVNGAEALELARRTRPDLIISDILMPQMDGFALCRECKRDEHLSDIPFVFYTATYTDPRDEALALQLGAARFIVKPVETDEFIAILREVRQAHAAGELVAAPPQLEEETAFYRLYNEALIRKLEDKMLDLEQVNRKLTESEERFRRLAENAPDLIYRYELVPQRGLSYVSPSATVITGYTPAEHYADPELGLRIVHPDDRPIAEGALGALAAGQPLTLRWIHKDGHIIWTEHHNAPVFDHAGNLIAIEGIARDITKRKLRERELEAIAAVSAALRQAQTHADMVPLILDQLLALLHVDGAALALFDPGSGELRIEQGGGVWTHLTGQIIPPGESADAQVLNYAQPFLDDDAPGDPRRVFLHIFDPCRAAARAPLVAERQIIGVLWIGSTRALTDHDLRLLVPIADIAANAIHRAALFEETARRVAQLEALKSIDRAITTSFDLRVTLQVLLEQVTAQLHTDAAAVLLLNPHLQMLDYGAGRGFRTRNIQNAKIRLGEDLAGRAALERRIVHADNLSAIESSPQFTALWAAERFASYHGVPLIAKGQVKGVLEVYHRAPFHPTPAWISFLEALAGQAALAIDNAQLLENLEHSNSEIMLAYDTTIEGWSRTLDLRNHETEGHTRRGAEITVRLARAMGVAEAELVHIRHGALLHDIGMMGVPDSILHKRDRLTEEERKSMRAHPQLAYDLISPIPYLRQALDIPYCHHEKWDGTGYPRGLKGEQIPLAARIFVVVDMWDALRSDRPYRAAWPQDKVLEHIRSLAGTSFDPKVVELFFQVVNPVDSEYGK